MKRIKATKLKYLYTTLCEENKIK